MNPDDQTVLVNSIALIISAILGAVLGRKTKKPTTKNK